MNCILKDLVRAMLLHKNVPEEFWADVVVTAVYIRNCTTSPRLPSDMTPRSSEALMIGCSSNQKGYKLWDITKEDFVVSRDVIFDEQPSKYAILADSEEPDQGGGDPDEDPSLDYDLTQ
eukprot:IDg19513t1